MIEHNGVKLSSLAGIFTVLTTGANDKSLCLMLASSIFVYLGYNTNTIHVLLFLAFTTEPLPVGVGASAGAGLGERPGMRHPRRS